MIEKLILRGNKFLGSDFPIIGGAMTWVSDRNLVAAISNAGGFGVIASGPMSPKQLEEEIIATQNLTKRNFGVNLITLHPELDQMIKTCIINNVKYIILAGSVGKITKDLLRNIKDNHIKILAFAPSLIIAKGLVRMGVDAIILEGMEAGGHIGPVSTITLAQEILPYLNEVPIFIGGGIGHGSAIASFLQMGASGVQLGSKFVCSFESPAHQNFKKKFIDSMSRDTVTSIQLSEDFYVIPVRSIKNQAYNNFIEFQKQVIDEFKAGVLSKEEGQLKIERFWAGSLRKAVIDGDIENGSLMAGQSVGMVHKEESVEEIIDELIYQTKYVLTGVSKYF